MEDKRKGKHARLAPLSFSSFKMLGVFGALAVLWAQCAVGVSISHIKWGVKGKIMIFEIFFVMLPFLTFQELVVRILNQGSD
jgi:hypothetical protein